MIESVPRHRQMKDWRLDKIGKQTLLVHCCGLAHNGGDCYLCPRGKKAYICCLCSAIASEEITFVADLANCEHYFPHEEERNVLERCGL